MVLGRRPAFRHFVTAPPSWRTASRDRFAAETARAHVLELPGSHYLFIDRRDEVVAAMRELLG